MLPALLKRKSLRSGSLVVNHIVYIIIHPGLGEVRVEKLLMECS